MGLRDQRAIEAITQRILRVAGGNFGDAKPVGGGVSELRIHYGPGYRVYFTRVENTMVVLLCGGDKRTQKRDIKTAIRMAGQLKE